MRRELIGAPRTGQQRKHPRKAQERLDGRVAAFNRHHVPIMEKNSTSGAYTCPGSRKR